MKQNIFKFFSFNLLLFTVNAEELSLKDVDRFLQSKDVRIKIENEKVLEAQSLTTSNMNNFIPELKMFGGIKSDEQKLEFEKEHFWGIRSELTLFDGGIRQLENEFSVQNLHASKLKKETIALSNERFLVLSLFEEAALKEKIEQLKLSESKQREVLSRARGKKNAGILSETALVEIEFNLLKNQQKISDFTDRLQILLKEREYQLALDDQIQIQENFDKAYVYLLSQNSLEKRTRLQRDEQLAELHLEKIENQKERQLLKPKVLAFAEKGFSRKIDGEYLESDHRDRLVFGLNIEIPLLEEGAKNVNEYYAKKSKEKRLELAGQLASVETEKERELAEVKKAVLNRELQRKEEKLKRYEALLKLSWTDVVRGQKEINDYSENLEELLNEKLELIDQKVEQVKELY